MTLKNLNNPRLMCSITDKGIRMRSGHAKGLYMFYGYDGTYEVGKRKYPTVYGKPVIMTKICRKHHTLNSANPHYIYLKARNSLSSRAPQTGGWIMDSSLADLKTKCCQFVFTLTGNDAGGYTTVMTAENIRHYDEELFCHVATDFSKETLVHKAKFKSRVGDMLRLQVPPMNLAAVASVDQFMDKIKLYTTFS